MHPAIRIDVATLCLAILCGTGATARADGVNWVENLSDGWAQSRLHDKPMLIFCTSDGCHYCELTDQQTFNRFSVVAAVSRHTIPVRLNANEHSDLLRQVGVRAFPTTLIALPDGTIIDHHVGFLKSEKVLAMLRRFTGGAEL